MKKLIAFLSLLISFSFTIGQVVQFPQVYNNNMGDPGASNLNIRQTASINGNVLISGGFGIGANIGAVSLSQNGSDQYFYNWVKVCLPSTTGSILYGYIACDEFYARINPTNNYATVTATSLNIRPSAGNTSQSVTIGGQNAMFGQNSIVALTGGNSNVGGTIWYQVYLTRNCSQTTGWLSGTFLTINSTTSNYKTVGGRVCNDANRCAITGNINGARIDISGVGSTYSSGDFYEYKLPINSVSTITCTHPSYSTSSPVSYVSYSASSHNYTKNFILSNTATYSITGRVTLANGTGVQGVAVSTTTGLQGITNSNGDYTIANIPLSYSGNVSASLAGYTFTPGSLSVSSSNNTGKNFTGTANLNTYSITGRVTLANGTGVQGVAVSTTTGLQGITNNKGDYIMANILLSYSGNVSASLAGYTFTPGSLSVSSSNNTGKNFTGTTNLNTYSITGRVTLANGTGVQGVAVSTTTGLQGITNSNGDYTIANIPLSYSGNVSASLAGYTFTPGSLSVSSSNNTGKNFTGTANLNTYSITGRVTLANGTGVQGVAVSTTTGLQGITNNNGDYLMANIPLSYSGNVSASLAGYTFSPGLLSVSSSNNTGKNFTATGTAGQVSYISIINSVIPPWQREDDVFNGSVNVGITNSYKPWKLEVYKNGSALPIKIYYSNTITPVYKIDFNSSDFSTPSLKENDDISYYVSFQDNSNIIAIAQHTKIIETKWNKKNVVYFRDVNSVDKLLIPLRWYNQLSPTHITIDRVGNTSFRLKVLPPYRPSTLERKAGDNIFPLTLSDQFLIIDKNNSTLWDVFAGDFRYTVWNGNTELETGYFDLTKIGKISETGGKPKLLVMIGGILNEMEGSVNDLKNNNANVSLPNSTFAYSVIEYCRNQLEPQFSSWYIAQGNGNFIKRNGHDLGIALEKIKKINDSLYGSNQSTFTSEIDLFCHSKGGLDTRAMLSSTTEAYEGPSFNYTKSKVFGKIKKVLFFDTPHRGAIIANSLGLVIGQDCFQIPGVQDLMNSSDIIETLKTKIMPPDIWFANISGYQNIITLNDGVVRITESYYPPLNTSDPNKVKQWFQNNYLPYYVAIPSTWLHLIIHKNKSLLNNGIEGLTLNCTNLKTNLIKVKDFLVTPDLNPTCSNVFWSNQIYVYKSKLSGAKISYKSQTDTIYSIIGFTDENGMLSFQNFGSSLSNDSLKIESNSAETLLLSSKDLISNNRKLPIAMIAKPNNTFVKYPSFSLTNSNPITNQHTIQIKVTANNVSSYAISQHNSINNFSPLTLSGNNTSIPLDTGFNRIQVRFIGVDTVVLEKDIYYYPDSLFSLFSRDITVNVPSNLLGCKVIANNQFYSNLNSTTNTLRVLKGVNEIKFSHLGYSDIIFTIDTSSVINLSMQPFSYSSLGDSTIFDFENFLNPQYWKTITIKNNSTITKLKVSVKQFDDVFPNMALLPESRKFIFRNLTGNPNVKLRSAIALDQINTPDSANVYLLTVKNGQYKKYPANKTNVTEYDPEVQKLAFDSMSLGANETQEIVLMKKQAPVLKIAQLNMRSGDTKMIPLNQLVTDPDSIRNDLTATVLPSANPAITYTVQNGNLVVTCKRGYVGIVPVTLTAEHDFISVSRIYYIIVNPPDIPVDIPYIYPNPASDYINLEYILKKDTKTSVKIYNKLGQMVKVLERPIELAGYHTYQIAIGNLASGVYTVSLNDSKTTVRFVKY